MCSLVVRIFPRFVFPVFAFLEVTTCSRRKWRRWIGCLIFATVFLQMILRISSWFADEDLQDKASYVSSPPYGSCVDILSHNTICNPLHVHLCTCTYFPLKKHNLKLKKNWKRTNLQANWKLLTKRERFLQADFSLVCTLYAFVQFQRVSTAGINEGKVPYVLYVPWY